jgi:uncharacterized protein (TIGR02246 family)
MTLRRMFLLVLLLLVSPVVRAAGGGSLSAEDIEKIKRVHSRYEEAWLKDDADGVRALFTDDAVLLPPHGDVPRIGQSGLNEFWFPPNAPSTKITKLVVIPKSIGGDGEIAYVWGTHEVAWTTVQAGKATDASHIGVFLNVLRKQPNGEWKISHHMWDDRIKPN